MKIKKITEWGIGCDEKPILISGPCSAETEEQVMKLAVALSKMGVKIFRAGIWKPRTRPNSFEGVGAIGLEWLKKVKQETGMFTATEVANVKHVEEALKANIDILWIGARTSANPFAVQAISEALRGVDIPVLVKNPVNPDVELWIGAIERLYKVGVTKTGAIHRGFSSYEHSIYRNIPQWQIPIELKRRLPDIPLICDPSHIGGKRELVRSIAQKSMDLDFDGLMIETHLDPDNAWSDAKQQITPASLKAMMSNLILREVHPEGVSLNTLEDLRYKIDKYDKELIKIIEKRMEVATLIGQYKQENNMTILQAERWKEILETAIEYGEKYHLSNEFINALFKAIHQESINKQTTILNEL